MSRILLLVLYTEVSRLMKRLEMIVPTSEQMCCIRACGAIDTQLSADGEGILNDLDELA